MNDVRSALARLPEWLPEDVRVYLDHTEGGCSIRALARARGCHASTILRKVRRTETRRDDPLVDRALTQLGRLRRDRGDAEPSDEVNMHEPRDNADDGDNLERHAARTLRALSQQGAIMAVTPDVAMAVVVREDERGRPRQLASAPREAAEMMALRGWIAGEKGKRVARYRITAAGRQVLNRLTASQEVARAGFAEAPAAFRHAGCGSGADAEPLSRPGKTRRAHRPAGAESPVQVLARRRDRNGNPYLTSAQLDAAERLRMDFELAQMDGALGGSWNAIMAGGPAIRGAGGHEQSADHRRIDARRRFDAALRALGPDLGEAALMVCCQERGMEQAEAALTMPARAGKYVLRIALNMLLRHYESVASADSDLIY